MPRRFLETEKVNKLFEGWDEAMFRACMDGTMGEVLVPERYKTADAGKRDSWDVPVSACLHIGDFYLFAGVPDSELLKVSMRGFTVLIPADEVWEKLLSEHFPPQEKTQRFAIRKDTVFDTARLEKMAAELPEGVTLKHIDGELYDQCMAEEWSKNLVQNFEPKERFLSLAVGIVALKDGVILAGCSSYARCSDAVEVEVNTRIDQRRKHLATACAAKLILTCLKIGLYPSWDAMNRESVGLAEKLGYKFSHAYTVFNHVRKKD